MKKVVFLDWYKTLSYSRFWDHLGEAESGQLDRVARWLFTDNKEIINPWMRGEVSTEEVLRSMSRDTGIDYDFLFSELKHGCERMEICLPNIAELVRSLRETGQKVVVATDNMDTFRRYTVPALKLDKLFDDILVSNELGVLKNDEEPVDRIAFFDDYLDSCGLHYADAVLLDDYPDSSGKYEQLQFSRILIDSPRSLEENLIKISKESI